MINFDDAQAGNDSEGACIFIQTRGGPCGASARFLRGACDLPDGVGLAAAHGGYRSGDHGDDLARNFPVGDGGAQTPRASHKNPQTGAFLLATIKDWSGGDPCRIPTF